MTTLLPCCRCPFLHRTTGDTERRYHLRYYKTGICIHETDSKGNCTKNGLHCAFAHGPHDLRSPVYDIRWAGCHAELMAVGRGGDLAAHMVSATRRVQAGTPAPPLMPLPCALCLLLPGSFRPWRPCRMASPQWKAAQRAHPLGLQAMP